MGSLCLHCQANGDEFLTQIHPVILSWLGQNWDIEIGTDCKPFTVTLNWKSMTLLSNAHTQTTKTKGHGNIGQWWHLAPPLQGCPRKPHVNCCCFTQTIQLTPKGMQSQKSGLFCRLPNGSTAQSEVGDKKWRRLTCLCSNWELSSKAHGRRVNVPKLYMVHAQDI
jgi:hypothetical protein